MKRHEKEEARRNRLEEERLALLALEVAAPALLPENADSEVQFLGGK